MKKTLFLLIVIIVPAIVFSQDDNKNKPKVTINGFIKNDMFWDTRQTVAAREGHFLLFPQPISEDPDGNDINAVPNFNFLSLQSRISVNIKGTKALNADVSGKIEGDFFAQKADNINLFRLRHAYIKLNWTSTELLLGQYWIPMFVTDCFPGTISFNTGVPFQPFGRNPQIRITQKFGTVAKVIAIANSQRDYTNRGIAGVTGSYLRNSAIPELSGQLHLKPFKVLLFGVGGSYKQIVPEIQTLTGYATNETVAGYNAIAFMKIQASALTIKLEGVYGQNIPDVLSLGGFGVSTVDSVSGKKTYTPLNTASAWADVSLKINKLELGVFGGYTMNMGANEDIIGEIYGLGTNIESMYRVSSRIAVKLNKVKFALEGEYTVANYGSTKDNKGIPTTLTEANNFRVLFASYYIF